MHASNPGKLNVLNAIAETERRQQQRYAITVWAASAALIALGMALMVGGL